MQKCGKGASDTLSVTHDNEFGSAWAALYLTFVTYFTSGSLFSVPDLFINIVLP